MAVRLSGAGQQPRDFVVRVDRAGQLATIETVEGVPSAALGNLGISELLLRATTLPSYLKDDWFRDWGELQQFTPYYRDARQARLDLGSTTRSGLWSPAPLRH